jgi:hypothetical protein
MALRPAQLVYGFHRAGTSHTRGPADEAHREPLVGLDGIASGTRLASFSSLGHVQDRPHEMTTRRQAAVSAGAEG